MNQREESTMHQRSRSFTFVFVSLVGLLAGTSLGVREVAAEVLDFITPFAEAQASDLPSPQAQLPEVDWKMDADFSPYDLVVSPKYAIAGVGGATAHASASLIEDGPKIRFGLVSARALGDNSIAFAKAMMVVEVSDPQGRAEVVVDVEYMASANVQVGGTASFSWRLDAATGEEGEVTLDGGKILRIALPESPSSRPIFPIFGSLVRVTRSAPEDPGLADYEGFYQGRSVGIRQLRQDTAKTRDSGQLGLRPGSYVVEINTFADGPGIAVADPVIRPNSRNPDVVVTVHGAFDPTPRSPLFGMTAEDMAAAGFNPAPFVELGFIDPPASADTTPPTTTATPTPDPNANGWNPGPVTVNLGATDGVEGSGVKELHYTLEGASTDSQVLPGASASLAISAEGTTTVTYFAVDDVGNQEVPKTLTVRIDWTPPVLAGLPAEACSLSPPDHSLVPVASVTGSDALSGLAGAPVVTAASNEPADGTGDGDLAPDVVITEGAVEVRAERAESGTGRVYTITATASDFAGNTATATGTCRVPGIVTTTTTLPSTVTTTTLPDDATCPADDAGGLGCLCEHDLGSTVCPGAPLPPSITRAFGQACRVVARGMSAGPGRKGRRSLARAAASFARALRAAGRPRVARSLSPSCQAAVAASLGDAQARARRLEARSAGTTSGKR